MIARLRTRHRRMVLVLAPLVLAGFVASVVARPKFPEAAPHSDIDASTWTQSGAFDGADVAFRRTANDGRSYVEIVARTDVQRPDVLVYWQPQQVATLVDAVLLGSLAGTEARRFELPGGTSGGALALFSLGHQELFAHAALTGGE